MLAAPFVRMESIGSQWLASAGLELRELLRVRLRVDEPGERLRALSANHNDSMRLVESVARMADDPLSLELHVVTWPSFDPDRGGSSSLALRISAQAADREQAMASCLSHFLALWAAVRTLWSQAWFAPIAEESSYWRFFRPFAPQSCFALLRQRAELTLTEPFFLSRSRTIGFADQPRFTSTPETVDHLFPWAPSEAGWAPFLQYCHCWPAPTWCIVRLIAPEDAGPFRTQLQSTLRTCELLLSSMPPDQIALRSSLEQLTRLNIARLSALGQTAVGAAAFVLSPGLADSSPAAMLGQCLCRAPGDGQSASVFEGGFAVEPCDVARAAEPFFLPANDPLSPAEAASVFRLPVVTSETATGLPLRGRRTLPAELRIQPSAGSLSWLAVNRHLGQDRRVRVPLAHRFKHVFLLGMTGTGKSTYMLSLLLRDIEAGHGVCLIDPHGDLADDVLMRFPAARQDDLIVMDLADDTACVPLNFLRWSNQRERDLIVDDIYRTMDRIYDFRVTGGPIFERYFRGALKLLMGEDPEGMPVFTLLEVPVFFQSNAFRRRLKMRVRDHQLKDFLDEVEAVSGDCSLKNVAPYITSKFTRFLQDAQLRRMVGHGEMKLDWHQVLGQQKVLVMKLGRGRFGAEAAELLLGLLLSRFRCAVMGRATLAQDQRRPFFLYVDELGSLAQDPNFSHLLAEARKYRVGLVVATQYGRQLRDGSRADLLSAVLGNAGTLISFRVGVEDAEILAPMFAPRVHIEDLVELPNWEAFMRLHLDQAPTPPFSIVTERPGGPERAETAAALVERSKQQWTVSPEECDSQAARRRESVP